MSNVNNLNIFTFIKDIYQSLKHIDKTMTISNDDLIKRISKLEDTQQILIDKLANIENILIKIGEMNKPNTGLDKNIEFELLEKMKRLNQNEVYNSKLSLKQNELTFANILENNYSFNDINNSLDNSLSNINNNDNTLDNTLDNTINNSIINNTNYSFLEDNIVDNSLNNESLEKLLF